MFGQDAHSQAMLGQWRRSKQLRDPKQVMCMAEGKGLHVFNAHTLDASSYLVDRGGELLFRGSLEDVAKFVEDYTIVSVR